MEKGAGKFATIWIDTFVATALSWKRLGLYQGKEPLVLNCVVSIVVSICSNQKNRWPSKKDWFIWDSCLFLRILDTQPIKPETALCLSA